MISIYSYSINDSKKTIGVLRTIGVGKSDIKKIFTVECIAVFAFSYAVALVVNPLVLKVINWFIGREVLCNDGIDFFRFRLIIAAIVGLSYLLMSIVSVIIPLRKYSRVKIIDLIK